MTISTDPDGPAGMLEELGFATRMVGGELHGAAPITPAMHVPGLPRLRTSVLAVWTDTLTGLLATQVTAPRVPVTLELDVQLYRPAPADGTVRGVARAVKVGRLVFVADVEFTVDGEPLAIASASFMTAPDPGLTMPSAFSVELAAPPEPLSRPFAERAGCVRRGPGAVVLTRPALPEPDPNSHGQGARCRCRR